MLKALIPVEMTLASNIALRYACRKSETLGLGLQPIHVEEPDEKPHSAESGWIRRTWESGLQEAGREEVQRILDNEELDCFIMPRPIITVGDREEEILRELRHGGYDLFIEGAVSNFNLGEFRKLLRSKIYKHVTCPTLMVKNLIMSDRVALLAGRESDLERLMGQFGKFFSKPETEFDLYVYATDALNQEPTPEQILEKGVAMLKEQGRAPGKAQVLQCMAEHAAEELKDYGMLVSVVDRKSSRKSPLTEILGRVPCPLLLCW